MPSVGVEARPGAPAAGTVDGAPAMVMLRPIASGLPFGFFGLVIAASVVGAQAYGFLPASAGRAVGLLLLSTVMLQMIGGISCILARDVISASFMLVFSAVWLGTALDYIVLPQHALLVLGVWYLGLAPVIGCLIVSGTSKLALSMVPMVGLPTFVVTAIWLLDGGRPGALGQAAGVMSWALAGAGLYAGFALLLEDARRRTVIPTMRRGPMKEAFTGDFASQLTNVEHEAGVRRYV